MAPTTRFFTYIRKQNLRKVDKFLKHLGTQQLSLNPHRCLSITVQHSQLRNESNNLVCDGIVRSPFPDIIPRHITITEFIWENLDRWPNHVALECGITGRKYTYSQLRTLSLRFATSLRRQGLRPRNVISVMLPNIPEYAIIILGAMEAGLVVSTVNPMYTHYELSYQLQDNNSSAIVVLPEFLSIVDQAKKEIETKTQKSMPLRTILLNISSEGLPNGTIGYKDMVSDSIQISDIQVSDRSSPDETALVMYSSGTTGLPKGVELTHWNIVNNILQGEDYQIKFMESATQNFQEVVPGVLPFYHIYGMSIILLKSINIGAKVVTLPRFEPGPFLSILKDYKASVLCIVPPIVLFLANNPMVTPEHLKSLKFIINGAGPVGVSDKEKVMEKSNRTFSFCQGYGLTESSPLVFVSPISRNDFTFMVPVRSTIVKIMKPDGSLAKPNEDGEICVRGHQVMKGYLNKPEVTRETIDENGYLHTGDLGYYDEDGGFHIVDRIKELIKVKGFQVAPAELEAIIRSYANIEEAAVIGFPDSRNGEKPVAFLVKSNNKSINEEDLKNYISQKVAPFKRVNDIVFVDSIPKSPSGKILRRIIKEEYLNKKKLQFTT